MIGWKKLLGRADAKLADDTAQRQIGAKNMPAAITPCHQFSGEAEPPSRAPIIVQALPHRLILHPIERSPGPPNFMITLSSSLFQAPGTSAPAKAMMPEESMFPLAKMLRSSPRGANGAKLGQAGIPIRQAA